MHTGSAPPIATPSRKRKPRNTSRSGASAQPTDNRHISMIGDVEDRHAPESLRGRPEQKGPEELPAVARRNDRADLKRRKAPLRAQRRHHVRDHDAVPAVAEHDQAEHERRPVPHFPAGDRVDARRDCALQRLIAGAALPFRARCRASTRLLRRRARQDAFCGSGYSFSFNTQPGVFEKSIRGGEKMSIKWFSPGELQVDV